MANENPNPEDSSKGIDDNPSILLAILDLHPLSWSRDSQAQNGAAASSVNGNGNGNSAADVSGTSDNFLSLDAFLNQLLVFLNSHLAMKWGNELVVYAALAGGKSELLYSSEAPNPSLSHSLSSNSFEPFHTLSETIRARLHEVVKKQIEDLEEEGGEMEVDGEEGGGGKREEDMRRVKEGPAIVPALLRTLCHINRLHPLDTSSNLQTLQSSSTGQYLLEDQDGSAGSNLKARILIVNNSGERGSGGGGYVGLMNAVFAAQKRKTPIDVINLNPMDSIFLQQASHLTHGIYYKVPDRTGLIHYLNLIFLAPPSMRESLSLPSQDKVDFRAVCFCHHRVVDIGFVCSVCLSIFCEPKPICETCKSRFPPQSVMQLKKSLPATLLGLGGGAGAVIGARPSGRTNGQAAAGATKA